MQLVSTTSQPRRTLAANTKVWETQLFRGTTWAPTGWAIACIHDASLTYCNRKHWYNCYDAGQDHNAPRNACMWLRPAFPNKQPFDRQISNLCIPVARRSFAKLVPLIRIPTSIKVCDLLVRKVKCSFGDIDIMPVFRNSRFPISVGCFRVVTPEVCVLIARMYELSLA